MPKIRPDSAIFISLMALLLLFLLLPIQPPAKAYVQAPDVEYWAVIVGVADYEHMTPLFYADNDAQDLYDKLSPYWGADHIKLLIDRQATKAGIQSAITGWLDSKEGDDDIVLFFFSGHGTQDGGHEYLSPYDALTYSYANSIQDTQLDSWLDELESTKVVVILDACYSGGFIAELGQTGRVIMAACAKNKKSYEGISLEHGVFSYYILDGFDYFGLVDTDGNGEISAEELFYYAEPKVAAYGDKDQHPQISDGYTPEELVLLDMQHYLTIESDYGEYQWGGWDDSSSRAIILITPSTGTLIRHIFTGWSEDSTATTATATVLMNGPKTVIANWRTDYTYLQYILIGGVAGATGAASVIVIILRRRRKASEEILEEKEELD